MRPVQEDKAKTVKRMFGEIAPRYDFLNRLLSMGVDRRWRRQAVQVLLAHQPVRILDVATGTGDLALLLKKARLEAEVVGLDFVPKMLELARRKAQRSGLAVSFQEGDALALPFANDGFEALSSAFGFRNFTDYPRALKEFYRVLAPGGRLVILEFPPPPGGFLGRLYAMYFNHVLPWLGGWISGRPEAYRYLPTSVNNFPQPEVMVTMMQEAGFKTSHRLLSAGLAALFIGDKFPVVESGGSQ